MYQFNFSEEYLIFIRSEQEKREDKRLAGLALFKLNTALQSAILVHKNVLEIEYFAQGRKVAGKGSLPGGLMRKLPGYAEIISKKIPAKVSELKSQSTALKNFIRNAIDYIQKLKQENKFAANLRNISAELGKIKRETSGKFSQKIKNARQNLNKTEKALNAVLAYKNVRSRYLQDAFSKTRMAIRVAGNVSDELDELAAMVAGIENMVVVI